MNVALNEAVNLLSDKYQDQGLENKDHAESLALATLLVGAYVTAVTVKQILDYGKVDGANVDSNAKDGIVGIDYPFRDHNPNYPPHNNLVDYINSEEIKALANNIDCIDCSEIAEKIFRAAGGEGYIIQITPKDKSGRLKLYENGEITSEEFIYHQIYTDGKYVYDPRLKDAENNNIKPVPLGDWRKQIRDLNPNGINIKIKR